MEMYVRIVGTFSKVWTNRVRLQILLVVSRTGNMFSSQYPFAPENLVSRDGFDLFRRLGTQGICEMV